MSKRLASVVAALAFFAPLAAFAQAEPPPNAPESVDVPSNPARCARYAREIIHYQQMAGRAEQLGNDEWQANLEAHVEQLRERAEPQCPEIKMSDSSWETLMKFLRLAGSVAVSYFTFGAF
jgi:hypothetical protein